MHFAIPDTQELKDGKTGSTCVVYNIQVNGISHCTLRYRQLLHLHDQISREFRQKLPNFPPKKLLPLTALQAEERRLALEKYIQSASQEVSVANSQIFNGFLLQAQKETHGQGEMEDIETTVHLMDGQKLVVNDKIDQNSTGILWKFLQQLGSSNVEAIIPYFSLYIVTHKEGSCDIIRKLQDFESPYLSLKILGKATHKLVVRKSYWDSSYDDELFNDPTAVKILYSQAIAELKLGWIKPDADLRKQLDNTGDHIQFLKLVRSARFYNYVHFGVVTCDHPKPGTKLNIAAGNKELFFTTVTNGGPHSEGYFRVTRMRCWRITVVHDKDARSDLSIEYLISKDRLDWITITSEHAILMSVCLQSMVDELVGQNCSAKAKQKPLTNGSSQTSLPWSYVKRNGSVVNSMPNTTKLSKISAHPTQNLVTRLSSVSFRRKTVNEKSLVENEAFEGIRDEDL